MNERSLFDLNPLSRGVMGICGVMVWPWLLMLLVAPLGAKEGDKAEAEKKTEKEKVALPEAAEVALRGFVDKLTAAKQRLYTEGMLEVVLDLDQKVGGLFGVKGIPHTVVVGPDGKVAWVSTGYSATMAKELTEVVRKLLP